METLGLLALHLVLNATNDINLNCEPISTPMDVDKTGFCLYNLDQGVWQRKLMPRLKGKDTAGFVDYEYTLLISSRKLVGAISQLCTLGDDLA